MAGALLFIAVPLLLGLLCDLVVIVPLRVPLDRHPVISLTTVSAAAIVFVAYFGSNLLICFGFCYRNSFQVFCRWALVLGSISDFVCGCVFSGLGLRPAPFEVSVWCHLVGQLANKTDLRKGKTKTNVTSLYILLYFSRYTLQV